VLGGMVDRVQPFRRVGVDKHPEVAAAQQQL